MDISSATARVSPNCHVINRSTVLCVINRPIIYKDLFFKDFTNHIKKTKRMVLFSSRPFLTFLNIRITNEVVHQSEKQDSFRDILKGSGRTYFANQGLLLPF